MESREPRAAETGAWLRPREETQGAIRYLDTIRERWWLILATTLVAVAVAGLYIAVTPPRYEAEADLLVTPVSGNESADSGLGLITESNDPTQTVSTAARLVSTPAVAAATVRKLGLHETPQQLLDTVAVEPIAQSSLIAVLAKRKSSHEAALVANAFATSAIEVLTGQLHSVIASQLPALERRLRTLPSTEQSGPGTLGQRVTELQAMLAAPDPTLRVSSPATPPSSPSSPKKKLAIVAGLLGGLVIGLGAAFASQALDPRLRREEQLRGMFRLPLLAWIPRVDGSHKTEGPLAPERLSPSAVEAYRTLRATLTATIGEGHRSILITSSSGGEGKSTTAINLAEALAAADQRVLLIEGDLRRPTIARALNIRPTVGVGAVLINEATMGEAIVTSSRYGSNLGFLLVESAAAPLADRLSLPTARKLVAEAEALADFVVIDSPPLTEVTDALPLAQEVDAVVVMARIGTSRLTRLANLGDILQQGGIKPAGIVVMGQDRGTETPYHSGRAPVQASTA
jgi:capsular exopolysaccharide synthesis family protein